ncbi:bifunctional orotidine-5'-phosphate decarboxylase/orotate phosphoribosyltransferase [Tumidithrix helvetica PCC 7403]|uniref:bifunctional orotidine-5'-phosphate decarboxylase/orotate phosphoribosyltransferase n=1 Tax=Tumidithrix helvetica TaxID=3457545 RepID=UPI003CBF946C
MNFATKLNAAIGANQSILCLGLEPNPEVMPANYLAKYEADESASPIDSLWEWMQFIIHSTSDLVCAYKPTLGFYTALGAPGLELLSKTLAAIPSHIPIILDAKHADLNSSTVMARTAFEQWQVDAITISPYMGQDIAARFLMYTDKAIFIQCHSSNTTAKALQEYPDRTAPLYLEVVKTCQAWGSSEQLGLEVGAATPEALARIRAAAPERLILGRSLWANVDDLPKETDTSNSDAQSLETLQQILDAGLDANGEGLLIPVNQDVLTTVEPANLVRSLRDRVNQSRLHVTSQRPACPIWLPDVCLLNRQPHLDLILQLYDIGCIMFGEYVQASGAVFPYYIDLRKIISNPQVFEKVIHAYAEILENLHFDRIAGIPYGSLPTATGLALRLNYPMIFPRKEVKAHGARRLIEGNFHAGETIVVVDDILISGKSVMEGAEKLKVSGLRVEDIVVFIDHEHGVQQRLSDNGYRSHAVLKISEITETLYQAGRLNEVQFQTIAKSETG